MLACPTATFCHRAGWQRVLRDSMRHDTHFLYCETDGRIEGVLPLAHVRSLLFGNFLAPGFFLSLSGAVLSLLVLAFAQHLPARWFGPVSLSILAAFAHIGGQLLLARAWLIPHDGVFLLTPLFAAAALVFGTINGLIAAKLLAEPAPTEAVGLVRR